MRLAIMQPYFMPYIGYWQLLSAVDCFILYDNIQYTKKGWINRNRFLLNGHDELFSVPLKKDSEYLDVSQRSVADDFNRGKLLNQFEASYRKAPFFEEVFPLVTAIIKAEYRNLFEYLYHSLRLTAAFMDIATPVIISSTIAIDHSLRGQDKVLALCKAMKAGHYINAIGGQDLYSKSAFDAHSILLSFIKARPITYPQFASPFVSNLSVIDVMMFNSRDDIRAMLSEYDLVT